MWRDMLVAAVMVTHGGVDCGKRQGGCGGQDCSPDEGGAPKSGSEGSGKGPSEALPGNQHRSLRQQILGPTIPGPGRPGSSLHLFWGEGGRRQVCSLFLYK